jgi:uncharacterized protein (UPF0548 family)
VRAIRDCKMFVMDWIKLCWRQTPIETGASVAVLVSDLGFWSPNACRIVYVIAEQGACQRYGFAYGTLPEHGERGEERFTVEFHAADQSVWYDLYSFSRPGALACLAYPFIRWRQWRPGSNGKNPREEKEKKEKSRLPHTGLLMEGPCRSVLQEIR